MLMTVVALWLVLIAPLPYWAAGLPWVSADRTNLAPLLGCALTGLYAEWAMIAGLPVPATVAIAILASAVLAIYRHRKTGSVGRDIVQWLPFYWVAVLAASLSPFPVLGSWSGDWLIMYRMGEAVVAGNLPITLLTRPPLFGASTAPLWLLQPGLIPYQLMAAVASAAAIGATLQFMRFLRPEAGRWLLIPLLLSPFFLHHTAAAWSKMLAGALVLAAVNDAFRSRRVASALLFALAVAVHEGSIIWAPCVLLCHALGPRPWQRMLQAGSAMAAFGVLIVGPILFWVLATYGMAAKIASNPVITDAGAVATPFALKTILGVLASFIGWGPIEVIARWIGHSDPMAPSIVAKEGYWLITSWNTTLAATLLGLFFPFVIASRQILAASRPAALPPLGAWASFGIGAAVVLNSALAGFYSSEGMTQAALVPLVLGAYAIVAGQFTQLGENERPAMRRVIGLMTLVATLPWLLTNAGTAAGLWLSASLRHRFLTGSEGDYLRVVDNHLQPLGMAAFPGVPCLAAALLALWLMAWRRNRLPLARHADQESSEATLER